MESIQKGLYYHYKHDPAGAPNNYTYEVVGTAFHTETEEVLVVYRPLYDASDVLGAVGFFVRPLAMFLEDVEVPGGAGKRVPRFSKVD